MATGDQTDILSRLKAVLPGRWFPATAAPGLPSTTPVLDALLSGCAAGWAFCYSLLAYVRLQTRIATGTDIWLDVMAEDYFGPALSRFVNEGDPAFSLRIRANLLPELGTRAGLIAAVTLLTGTPPIVFEPTNARDTGGWGIRMGYGVAGGWGCSLLPFQAFITVTRPRGGSLSNVNGYGGFLGGYGAGASMYASAAMSAANVPDAAIYQTVADAAPAGTIMWTRLTG
jgi:hypothetical protein